MYRSTSVILPVINETFSLIQTIDKMYSDCMADIEEFIVVVCHKTSARSLEICRQYAKRLGEKCVIHHQKLPFLGGALREAFELASGSHVILMASDLETDPANVKDLIQQAKLSPSSIITASRWRQGGSFHNYNPVKLICNLVFQKSFSIIYRTNLTDMTYGFRIFPTQLVQQIVWEELKHPFLLETLVKPLRLGVDVKEIPTTWKARIEGESQNTFMQNFRYFKIGIKTRFYPKSTILKKEVLYEKSYSYRRVFESMTQRAELLHYKARG